MEVNMKSGIAIVMSNPEPQRELTYPRTWVLHLQNAMISLTIVHDNHNKPHVASKDAA